MTPPPLFYDSSKPLVSYTCRMTAAGRWMAPLLAVVFCAFIESQSAPASASRQLLKPMMTSRHHVRRRTCAVIHFPPPDQHIYCCKVEHDCQCPRRMGICAPEVTADDTAPSSAASSSLTLLTRLFCS